MKKLLIVLFILFMASVAWAEPHFYCDVSPDATAVILVLNDGDRIEVPVSSYYLRDGAKEYDLKDLLPGQYVLKAYEKQGVWESGPSVPFDFTKPALSPPTNQSIR